MNEINFFEEKTDFGKEKINNAFIYIIVISTILFMILGFDYISLKGDETKFLDKKNALTDEKIVLEEKIDSKSVFDEKGIITENYRAVNEIKANEIDIIGILNTLKNSIDENLIVERIVKTNNEFSILGYCNFKDDAVNLIDELNERKANFNLESIRFENDYYSYSIVKDEYDHAI